MKILIADDEFYLRKELTDILEGIIPGSEYMEADDSEQASALLKGNSFDIAFLDINMPGRNGLELAKELRDASPSTKIVFVTAFNDYALDAFKIFADGYLLKPVMKKDLQALLAHILDKAYKEDSSGPDRLDVRCFGNFEVFYKNKPVNFSRKLGKELFAYLVALGGASASRSQICSDIFPESILDDQIIARFKSSVFALRKDLSGIGFEGAVIHNKNSYAVNTELISCDYYEYLADKENSRFKYLGEFMNQYSWAEEYIYRLENY